MTDSGCFDPAHPIPYTNPKTDRRHAGGFLFLSWPREDYSAFPTTKSSRCATPYNGVGNTYVL